MSNEILKMMNESTISKLLNRIDKKHSEDSVNNIDQNPEKVNMLKYEKFL